MAPGPLGLDRSLRWDLVERQAPIGERLTVRLAAPDERDDVFIAIDDARRRYVLLAIPYGEPHELSERISRGISLQTVEMKVGGGQTDFFIEVACLEANGHAAFDVVIGEFIQALSAGASIGRVRLVQNVLAKWRRFWSGVNQGLLSREQQLGLFGELWFISRWLTPSIGTSKGVELWRGPAGARNDFETTGLGIEVKTTGRLDSVHVIHGVEQLLEPSGGALLLFCLSVREEASGGENLSDLVQEVRAMLAEDFEALSRFESMLYAYGYEDSHASEYSKLALRVRSEGLYRVQPSFPRLIPASFAGGVPAGIGNVTYELRVESAAPWLVATTPTAARALLNDFISN